MADALVTVALAPECVVCRGVLDRPSAGPVCAACWAAIRPLSPPFCGACGDPLPSWRALSLHTEMCARCRRLPLRLSAARAAGEYDGTLRGIIHAFKYDGRRSLAAPLGALLRTAAGPLLDDVHCAVPVPLHAWRRMQRGFNQAADLARTTGVPVVHALWRRRATLPQTGLTAAARRRNVRDAFRLSPLLTRRSIAAQLSGRIVLLVDDVRTTGATLEACARALRDAGVTEVRALTVARAAPPGAGRKHGHR